MLAYKRKYVLRACITRDILDMGVCKSYREKVTIGAKIRRYTSLGKQWQDDSAK